MTMTMMNDANNDTTITMLAALWHDQQHAIDRQRNQYRSLFDCAARSLRNLAGHAEDEIQRRHLVELAASFEAILEARDLRAFDNLARSLDMEDTKEIEGTES